MGVEVKDGQEGLLLWVGQDTAEATRAALAETLRVERCEPNQVNERAAVLAPDVVVVAGDTDPGPDRLTLGLSYQSPGASIPVVTIGALARPQPKPRSRFGLVARLSVDEGPEELTRQLLGLTRSLSRRTPRWKAKAERARLAPLVDRFRTQGRVGLLVAQARTRAIALSRQGVAPSAAAFAARLEDVNDPLELLLHERPANRLHVVTADPGGRVPEERLDDLRVLIADDETARARALQKVLSQRGAQVRVVPVQEEALRSAKVTDPTLVIAGTDALLSGEASPLWTEARLAAASLLLVHRERVPTLGASRLLGPALELCRAERDIAERIRAGLVVVDRLETLGAARWMKVLGRCEQPVRLRVHAPGGVADIDLAAGKVKRARLRPRDARAALVEGRGAVDALLPLPFGRVLAGPPEDLAAFDATISGLEGIETSGEAEAVEAPAPDGRTALRDGTTGAHAPTSLAPRRSGRVPPPPLGGGLRVPKPSPSAPDAVADRSRPQLRVPSPTEAFRGVPPPVDFDRLARSGEGEETTEVWDRAGLPAQDDAIKLHESAALALPPEDELDEAIQGRRSDEPTSPFEKLQRRRRVGTDEITAPFERDLRATPEGAEERSEASVARSLPSVPDLASQPLPATPTVPALDEVEAEKRPSLPGPKGPPKPLPTEDPPTPGRGRRGRLPLVAFGIAGFVVVTAGLAAGFLLFATPGGGAPTPVRPGPLAEATPPVEAEEEEPTEPPVEATAPEPPSEGGQEPAPAPHTEGVAPRVGPEDVDALLREAEDAHRERAWQEEETLALRALRISPENPEAALRLGLSMFRQRRYDVALEWAERAERWAPNDHRPMALQGDIYRMTGRFFSAARAYRAALRLNRNYQPARRQLDRLAERGVEL